jgi:hypothetical protein
MTHVIKVIKPKPRRIFFTNGCEPTSLRKQVGEKKKKRKGHIESEDISIFYVP